VLQNANTTYNYLWQPSNNIDSSIIVSPIVTTIYTVSASNGTCNYTSTITVNATANTGSLAQSITLNSVAGTSCDTATQGDGLQVSYHDTNCNLVVTITDTSGGNVLGNVATCVTVDASVQTVNGQPYVARHYDITPTNDGAATLTSYFTQDDFNDYNAHPNVVNNSYPAFPTSGNNADPNIANIRVATYQGNTGLGSNSVEEIIPTSVTFANGIWSVVFSVTHFSSFYAHGVNANNIPLQVANIIVKGTIQNQQVILDWTVLQEKNTQLYQVLHSDNNFDFQTLAIIQNNIANHNLQAAYQYIYAKPTNGNNYYKIMQIDNDGNKTYSNTIKMIVSDNTTYTIYPNPIFSSATIIANTAKAETISIIVRDINGKEIFTQQSLLQKGENKIELPMQNVASGLYTIQITNAKGLRFHQLITKQ
jgi:Secretion system C-terminal sorting domain